MSLVILDDKHEINGISLEKVARVVLEEIAKAESNPIIRKPVSAGLYAAWMRFDEKERSR